MQFRFELYDTDRYVTFTFEDFYRKPNGGAEEKKTDPVDDEERKLHKESRKLIK